MGVLLTEGVMWIGFNADHISEAASITARQPGLGKGSVFEGCAFAAKCRVAKGDRVFGRHFSTFTLASVKGGANG